MVMNPKIGNGTVPDVDEEPEIAADPQAEAAEIAEDKSELEALAAQVEGQILRLPADHPELLNLQNELSFARTTGSTVALTAVFQDVDKEILKINAEEGKEIQQAAGGMIMGAAALGALANADGIAGALTPENQTASHESGKMLLAANMSMNVRDIPEVSLSTPEVSAGQGMLTAPRIDQGAGMGITDRMA